MALAELFDTIDKAGTHGLNPVDYHQAWLSRLSSTRLEPGQAADLELLATDAYLLLASHYPGGRINPENLDPEWRADRRELDLVTHLEQALTNNRISASLTELLPQQPGYQRLVEQLAVFLQRADWPMVPAGPKLEPDGSGPRVAALRARLAADGHLAASEAPNDHFDNSLADAIKAFQRRHGLDADGVVGSATLAELNTSRSDRIRQIQVNLERWRWMPNELGRRHVRVNIADYWLEAWQDVFQGWGANERRIDPESIAWRKVDGRAFPYHLVQRPGPLNALGQITFMLPNRFDVYLHDTPDKQLFERNERSFSSGCIRLQRPLDLAEWVLSETPGWTRADIDRALATGIEQTVRLKIPLPVHIQYWTAWVDDAGQLQLRRDLYGRDKALAATLAQATP